MNQRTRTLREWTAALERRLANVGDPSSIRGLILRR